MNLGDFSLGKHIVHQCHRELALLFQLCCNRVACRTGECVASGFDSAYRGSTACSLELGYKFSKVVFASLVLLVDPKRIRKRKTEKEDGAKKCRVYEE